MDMSAAEGFPGFVNEAQAMLLCGRIEKKTFDLIAGWLWQHVFTRQTMSLKVLPGALQLFGNERENTSCMDNRAASLCSPSAHSYLTNELPSTYAGAFRFDRRPMFCLPRVWCHHAIKSSLLSKQFERHTCNFLSRERHCQKRQNKHCH